VDASRFEFSLTVPRDARFADTVRLLAEQAARYAGCGAPDTETFAASVETAIRDRLAEAPGGEAIAVVVRRDHGPVEVVVDGHALTVEP
jgi:hypothetical protein